jgi:hypothetical protein
MWLVLCEGQLKLGRFGNCYTYFFIRWDSSVGTAMDYGLEGCGSILSRGNTFFSSTMSRPDLGAHPAFYPMGMKGSFPGGKVVETLSWSLTSIWYRGGAVRPPPPPQIHRHGVVHNYSRTGASPFTLPIFLLSHNPIICLRYTSLGGADIQHPKLSWHHGIKIAHRIRLKFSRGQTDLLLYSNFELICCYRSKELNNIIIYFCQK